jgi:hypothetical protein
MSWKGHTPTPSLWRRIWSICSIILPTTHEKGRLWK